MRSVLNAPSFLRDRPSLRRRLSSLFLALLATFAIILVLLGIDAKVPAPTRFKGGGPVMISISADKEHKTEAKKQAEKSAPAASTPPPPRPRIVTPKPIVELPPVSKAPQTQFIPLTQVEEQDFSLKMRTAAPAGKSGQQSASTAGDSQAVGTAPDGEPLYEAQWYRHPTHTELSLYLPKVMPNEGSGLVACKTAARYHVEDCIELGSSPPGSHLAGAVRQAAWQFLVRPPRRGGKDMIGTWVRIRIDYSTKLKD